MADLLRFVVALATQPDVRDRFRDDPAGVLQAEVDDAGELTGEDVEAATAASRRVVPAEQAERLRIQPPVRPIGDEQPSDAARRLLSDLCRDLDEGAAPRQAPPVRPVPSAVDPDPPSARPPAGGAPVPAAPPGLKGRRLWAVGSGAASGPTIDPDHPVSTPRPELTPVPEPEGGFTYTVLEVVVLPGGLPEAGIEPGARATVIAVHPGQDDCYEIEVGDGAGGRRFLGTVGPDRLAPLRR